MATDKFEYLLRYGDHPMDRDVAETLFQATDAAPGSPEKIEVMRRRCGLGQPLFHENDRADYNGYSLLDVAKRIQRESSQ
jgi:hypothetical protein